MLESPLWENLLVLQLAGVPAHVECPKDVLADKLAEVGPVPDFPYDEFSEAVDRRIASTPFREIASGSVEC